MERGKIGAGANGIHLNLGGKNTLSLSISENSLQIYGTDPPT